MNDEERNVESLRVLATEAGLKLSDDELTELLPRVKREKAMALSLRTLIHNDLEPASIFTATPTKRR